MGPLEDDEAKTSMSLILRIPRLSVPLLAEDASLHGKRLYSEVLEEYFLSIARAAPNFLQIPTYVGEPMIGMQRAFVYNGFDWLILGDLTKTDPFKIVRGLIDAASERAEMSNKVETSPENQEQHFEGYEAHFVPRLWLGKKPSRKFEERLENDTYREWHFFTCFYKKHLVRLEERSSIFVQCKEESDGLRLLNEIAGGLLLSNIPCLAFRKGMIRQANYHMKQIGSSRYTSFGGGGLTMDEARYFGTPGGISEELLKSYREVTKETFLSILERTEKALDQDGKSDHLMALVESFSSLSRADFRSAFVGAWITIESCCKTQYFLEEERDYSKAFDRAKGSTDSPRKVFRALNQRKILDEERTRALSKLYDVRNKVVHPRMYVPTTEEATKCFKFAQLLVRKELGFQP